MVDEKIELEFDTGRWCHFSADSWEEAAIFMVRMLSRVEIETQN